MLPKNAKPHYSFTIALRITEDTKPIWQKKRIKLKFWICAIKTFWILRTMSHQSDDFFVAAIEKLNGEEMERERMNFGQNAY